MSRIGYEELERELVRYKLLWVFPIDSGRSVSYLFDRYAEVVHENADRDATSSQRYSSLSLR